MDITRTRLGIRLSQHGIVLSELRTTPGPTHSVFDVLAALIAILSPPTGRIGVLGFAGGGMMAPLRALEYSGAIDTVDLDRTGYQIFRKHCGPWAGPIHWQQADALGWLRQHRAGFDLLMDDLSVPEEGDVIKPAVSWAPLPRLIRQRLKPRGAAVFNLLPPLGGRWRGEVARLASQFPTAQCIELADFENRILVAAATLPTSRELGTRLRQALKELGSRQARSIRVKSLPGSHFQK